MDRVLFASRELPPLPPDVAEDSRDYSPWARQREQDRAKAPLPAADGPLGLVMPVQEADLSGMRRTLRSLGRQTSREWFLVVTCDADGREVRRAAHRHLPWSLRRRVRMLPAPTASDAGDLLKRGLSAARGAAVATIWPGDEWAPDAIALLAAALRPDGVVYADEDRVSEDGVYVAPRLKPQFSPDFLLATGYVGRPFAVGAALAATVLAQLEDESGAFEDHWTLAACDAAAVVTHVPEVLCHRPDAPGPPDAPPDRPALAAFLRRRGDRCRVEEGPSGTRRIVRQPPPGTSVSIVIPFRDQPRFLRTCVDSVLATAGDLDVELVLVDNGSSDPEVMTLVDHLRARPRIRALSDDSEFNWARLNNEGVRAARGDVLVFLNNDIEARREGWLPALCAQAIRPDIGACGTRLVYPDARVQHCGIVVGLNGAAGHPLAGLRGGSPGYLDMAVATHECSAVTGACLATRRAVFDQLGGFDESLGVDLNDVDYCLRAAEQGYRTVCEPAAELIHHESPSRGTAGGTGDIVEFLRRWEGYINDGDRYFNPHLTRSDASCRLARPEEASAWNEWHSTLISR